MAQYQRKKTLTRKTRTAEYRVPPPNGRVRMAAAKKAMGTLDPDVIRQRMKERARTGKPSTIGGVKQVPGPTRTKTTKTPGEPMRTSPRKPGEKPGEGRLQPVTPKKEPIGGLKQQTIGQKQRAKKESYWQKVKRFATRKQIEGARAPKTMEERALSIGRTASRAFGGRGKPSQPGGIINERALREELGLKGPTERQRLGQDETETEAKAGRGAITEEERARAIKYAVGKHKIKDPLAKEQEFEVLEAPGKGSLGRYYAKGKPAPTPQPPPEAPKATKKAAVRQARKTAKKEPSLWERFKAGAARAGKKMQEVGAEALKEAQAEQQRARKIQGGQYGTKEQARKGAEAVKKAVVPKKFEPKKKKKKGK